MLFGLHREEGGQIILIVDSHFAFVAHAQGQIKALAAPIHGHRYFRSRQLGNALEVLVKVDQLLAVKGHEGVAFLHSGLFSGASWRKLLNHVGNSRKHPRSLLCDGLGNEF